MEKHYLLAGIQAVAAATLLTAGVVSTQTYFSHKEQAEKITTGISNLKMKRDTTADPIMKGFLETKIIYEDIIQDDQNTLARYKATQVATYGVLGMGFGLQALLTYYEARKKKEELKK